MKSIRLSLIVYFLVLLTAALGAVSWFSYRTTAESLRERQRDAQKMIEAQYETREKAARNELDREILRQARALAGMPLITIHYEAIFSANAIMTPVTLPGYVNLPLWLPDTRNWPKEAPKESPMKDAPPPPYVPQWLLLAQEKGKPRVDSQRYFPKYTHLQSSELLVANVDPEHPKEYFQTYLGKDVVPTQRSESMGDTWFTLTNGQRKLGLFAEDFDDITMNSGTKVRRVTLKTPVAGYGGVMFFWGGRQSFNLPPGGGGKGPKQPPRPVDAKTPTLFIQYASDITRLTERIAGYRSQRDKQIEKLDDTIADELSQLRGRMLWIAFATLGAIWLGGYGVIRLGLAPLSKMSEAVSQVSPTNFHLSLDPDTLPNELRPIAARLEEVLHHLQKAFAREKQAAADISHELRTPLAALMTTLDVALKKNRSGDEYREILDECRGSGQHMYQLVERLLTLARLDAGADQYRPAETDVTEVALNCADLIRPLARARGLALRLHMSDPIVTQTDPNKLREVLVNLLHNAVEYNKPGGAIDFAVERVDGYIRLEVRDTGIGIKTHEREHLFERFYRADPSRHADTPHAGLGLAIVKSYVDLMGGVILVESSDAGTTFRIEIPFVAPSAHDLATAVQAEPVLVER
jgi:heavy metal sensor kinase